MLDATVPPTAANLSPDDDLANLTVEELAERLLGDYAQDWLVSEHPGLGGRKPRDLIAQGNDESVRELLQAIGYGVFS